MVISMALWIACKLKSNSLSKIDDTEFNKMEKRGNLLKKLMKVQTGMFLSSLIDCFFVTTHQISHQKIPSSLTNIEYLSTYMLSVILLIFIVFYTMELFHQIIHINREQAKKKWLDLNQQIPKQIIGNFFQLTRMSPSCLYFLSGLAGQ